ncbi:MAG TPA: hypothetical protein PLJ21_08920 [Pseudobdellovibrionaceae bacterium]|nr:hypothetical protein [Pseudobdellovibrionaceae bacterium]
MSESAAKNMNNNEDSSHELVVATSSGRTLNDNEQSEFFGGVLDKSDLGPSGSLRSNVLTLVLSEKYDPGIAELKKFLAEDSPYPDFLRKIKPHVAYCIDLIYAIRAKRNFPGFNSLTRSKQQELREKFKEHFEQLKMALKKIENNLIDLRIGDSRSTIMVIWTFWYSMVAVFALAVILDLTRGGVLLTAWSIMNEVIIEVYEYLF